MGIEALSRGAARAVFVDQGAEAVRLVRENLKTCAVPEDKASVIRDSVPSAIRRLAAKGELFSLIFMDPPYGRGHVEKTLDILDTVAAPGALAVAEHSVKDESPSGLKIWTKQTERRYGDTLISIYSG
jgi:16S rRNA (guanine(966)-N(2))-methyltransferase RsmD